jgi:hypothetical protein
LNVDCNPKYKNMNTDYFYNNKINHKPANLVLILVTSIVLLYLMFEKRLAFFSNKTSFIKNK